MWVIVDGNIEENCEKLLNLSAKFNFQSSDVDPIACNSITNYKIGGNMQRIDLHIHTNKSDGALSPKE